jgi:hypothetical protein
VRPLPADDQAQRRDADPVVVVSRVT